MSVGTGLERSPQGYLLNSTLIVLRRTHCRIELSCSDGVHGRLIDGPGLLNRIDEGIESHSICVALHARCSGRQPIHDDARFAMTDERSSGADSHGWTAGQQNFLQS